jgi:hypothetical protein
MADPYIDPQETQPYGLFAREQRETRSFASAATWDR